MSLHHILLTLHLLALRPLRALGLPLVVSGDGHGKIRWHWVP